MQMAARKTLAVQFYNCGPADVARELIGNLLCRQTRDGICVGRIVETEAYLAAGDPAAHSFGGPNRKNASMFGLPGRAYVYTIHARQCVNVVTEVEGMGSAVLIRAVEPLNGILLMQRRRRREHLRDLCRGPARLSEAFEIGRNLDGWDLTCGQRLWIAESPDDHELTISRSRRIGVTSAVEFELRFFVRDSKYVSGTRRQNQSGDADQQ